MEIIKGSKGYEKCGVFLQWSVVLGKKEDTFGVFVFYEWGVLREIRGATSSFHLVILFFLMASVNCVAFIL